MPKKALRPCRHYACPELVESGYCDKHKQDEQDKINARQQYYDNLRGNFRQRGYTTQWDKVRAVKIRRSPLCERCLEKGICVSATIIHHIKTVKEHPELILKYDNLMSLCRSCHTEIHKA